MKTILLLIAIPALLCIPPISHEIYVGPTCNELNTIGLPHLGSKSVFESNIGSPDPFNFTLYVANTDGSRGMTSMGNVAYRNPVLVSHDDKIIVFTRLVNYTNQIFVANTDGSKIRQVTFDDQPKTALAISGDSKRIIFATTPQNDMQAANNFFSIGIEGENPIQITDDPQQKSWPAISGDGSTLAFDEYDRTEGKIFAAYTNGSGQHFVTEGSLFAAFPAISIDGTRLVFSQDNKNDSNSKYLFTVNTDGSGLKRALGHPIYSQSHSAISPGGTRIAVDDFYDYNNVRDDYISVANSDGTGYMRIAPNLNYYQDPKFSPDGSRLLFMSPVNGTTGLYLWTQGNPIPMLISSGHIGKFAFSNDGSAIFFSKTQDGTNQFYSYSENKSSLLPPLDYSSLRPDPSCKIPYGGGPLVVSFQPSQVLVSGINVYVTYQKNSFPSQVVFKASNDGGKTFGNAIAIQTPGAGSSSDPYVAASGSHVYLAWYAEHAVNTTSHVFLSQSDDYGRTFGRPWPIDSFARNGTAFVSDMIASGPNLFVTLNFNNYTSMKFDQVFLASHDYGNTFGRPVPLAGTGSSTESKMVSSKSHVYIIWNYQGCQIVECSQPSIAFRQSSDNGTTFGPLKFLNNDSSGSSPELAAAGNDVYASWQDGQSPDVFFSKSTDGGSTFGTAVELSKKVGESGNAQIVADGKNIYVGFYHFDFTRPNEERHLPGIYFTRSTDGGSTFSDPSGMFFNTRGGFFSLASSLSNVYLYALVANSTSDRSDAFLVQSGDGGKTFGRTVNLSSALNESSNPSKMAADGNSLYLVLSTAYPGDYLYFTASNDGGRTFGQMIKINNDTPLPATQMFHPVPAAPQPWFYSGWLWTGVAISAVIGSWFAIFNRFKTR